MFWKKKDTEKKKVITLEELISFISVNISRIEFDINSLPKDNDHTETLVAALQTKDRGLAMKAVQAFLENVGQESKLIGKMEMLSDLKRELEHIKDK